MQYGIAYIGYEILSFRDSATEVTPGRDRALLRRGNSCTLLGARDLPQPAALIQDVPRGGWSTRPGARGA